MASLFLNPPALDRSLSRQPAASLGRAAIQRLEAPPLIRLWHLSSLDAPTVAVVWSLAFAWAIGIRLPAWVPILLALVAWAVYIADRLLDARSGLHGSDTSRLRLRHHFHWRHRRIFVPVAVAAAVGAGCIVFSLMPVGARERNLLLGVAALAYFTRVHSTRNQPLFASTFSSLRIPQLTSKEMPVGLLFTAACALPSIGRFAAQSALPLWPLLVATVFFALLAWLNCHAIESWESSHRPSRSSRVFVAALVLALAGLLLAAILSTVQFRLAALAAAGAASALLLALLDRLRGHLTPLALRAAADLVLLTPLVLLLR